MKKSKLSLGMIACLLSVGSLAGCDPVKSSDKGYLLSYTVDGTTTYKVADDILKEYYDDSDKYQAIFDAIFKVIKRNYFSVDRGTKKYNGVTIKLGKPQMTKINAEADKKVAIDKQTAEDNADANGTRYKKEFDAILSENGVKTEEELHAKYVGEIQEETFDENFYTYFVDEMRGDNAPYKVNLKTLGKDFVWDGYLKDQHPYHMSHLMIELADKSDTNYADGTISEDNAKNLYTAVKELKDASSFQLAAYSLSDDESSRAKYGDLGIMDYDTGFINEFKLGIYAYEQFYLGKDASGKAIDASSFSEKYIDAVNELFNFADDHAAHVPTVPYSVFEELNSYSEAETDENSKPVIEGADLVFPRNVIYNKYLNRHAVFFVEGADNNEDTNGNFRTVSFNGEEKVVLCADDDPTKPIVCVRGSSQGKQEIHFMVVNRSPLSTYEVEDKDYYNTYYYSQDMYPHKADGTKLDTYTNFVGDERDDSEPRAQEIASKFKSFDSDKLNKYIFLKFMNVEKLTFEKDCKEIEKALMNWILTSVEKKENEKSENWKKTWNEYLDKLSRENAERKKLIPQACKYVFSKANEDLKLDEVYPYANLTAEEISEIETLAAEIIEMDVKTYWETTKTSDAFKKEGGLFNDGKAHI